MRKTVRELIKVEMSDPEKEMQVLLLKSASGDIIVKKIRNKVKSIKQKTILNGLVKNERRTVLDGKRCLIAEFEKGTDVIIEWAGDIEDFFAEEDDKVDERIFVVTKEFKVPELDYNEEQTGNFVTIQKGFEYYIERETKYEDGDIYYELDGVNDERWLKIWQITFDTYFKLKGSE